MSPAPRNFECPDTGELCHDPRCKRTFCIALKEGSDRALARQEAEAAELRKEAVRVIRLWCMSNGRPMPTGAKLESAVKLPWVLKMAKRNRAEMAALLKGGI
jgi:hypothetical protein